MADELHVEPGLVEQVLEVERLGAEAHQTAVCALIFRHIDLVGNGIQIETAGAGILGPGDEGLPLRRNSSNALRNSPVADMPVLLASDLR